MTRPLLALIFVLAACGDDGPSVTVLDNGAACEAESETEVCAGTCVTAFQDEVEIAGGLCTEECTWNEDQSDTCVDGEVCLRYNPTQEFYCFPNCETDADCRTEDMWTCACLDLFCSEKGCLPPL